MNPATVSLRPNACANAGESVLTGSEPKPTIATIASSAAS